MTQNNKGGKWLTTIAVAAVCQSVTAQSPDIQIHVHGVHFGGQVVYKYQIRNNSSSSIDAVTLGVPSPGKELPAFPWSANRSLSDVPSEVPLSQCKPLNNMSCSVGTIQFDYMSSPKAVIQMQGLELTQTPLPAQFLKAELIRPHTTSSFAEVYVSRPEPGYLSASGAVRLFDNHPKDSTGRPIIEFEVPFTKIDTAPPLITGSATATKHGGMLDVRVTLQVSDNFDSSPSVVLTSVRANEPLHPRDVVASIATDARFLQLKRSKGRLYYLTYSATDGSENRSTVVITVPGELP